MRGLKTKIAIHIALLLLISAILTDVLVMLIAQGILIRNEIQNRQKMMEIVGRWLVLPSATQRPAADPAERVTAAAMTAIEPAPMVWVGRDGEILIRQTGNDAVVQQLRAAANDALHSGRASQLNQGGVWAVVWWHAESVLVATPVGADGRTLCAGATLVSLAPIYARLAGYQRSILFYIVFNSAVLTLVGLYRIFRIYLRPIDRMVGQADAYNEDEDFLFSFRREDNELSRLSIALNRMLERITLDKQKLKESVVSLAKANADLKQAQDEIIRAEKMASVGRLASGIAHEIGNPIGIVLGYLDLLKQTGLLADERDDFLRRSETEIQRINTIIRQLLDLARPRPAQLRRLNAHAVIEEFVAAIRHQPMLSAIGIVTRLEAPQDLVWGDDDQLRQVLLNAVINAADAIHECSRQGAGTITIMSANEEKNEHTASAGLIVGIQDNGCGIATEQLQNIFDPFFTTKEPGKGTGLGLAVSYMIIEKMGGTMAAQSTPGHGTTLTFRLPLITGEESLA